MAEKTFEVSIPTGVPGISQRMEASRVFYSHRNGETGTPEVDGWYWVLTSAPQAQKFWIFYIDDSYREHEKAWDTGGPREYWGPLPEPEI